MNTVNNFLLGLSLLQILLAGCSHEERAESVSQGPVRVEPAVVDLGAFELVKPEKRNVVVTATNADGKVHRISSIQVSCSCMQFDERLLNREIGVAESLDIPVEISLTHQSGAFRQGIRIVVDDDEEHPIVVDIVAYLNTPPRPLVSELVFRKDQASEKASASILFTSYRPADEPDLSVKSVTGIPGISVKDSIVERNASQDDATSVLERLEVQLELTGSNDIGETSLGTVEFSWMDEIIPKVSVPVRLFVVPAVQVSPSTVYLGALPAGQSARGRFTVKSQVGNRVDGIQMAFEKSDEFSSGEIRELDSANGQRTFEFQIAPKREGRLDGAINLQGKDGSEIGSVKFWALVRP